MSVECEKKYRVFGLNEEDLKNISSRNLEQYYLNIENKKLRDFICYIFKVKDEELKDMAEARVRVVNGERYLLTVKGDGTGSRMELETELTFLGEDIIRDHAVSKISKTRYDYNLPNSCNVLEIDFYRDRDLVVAEMEYDPYEMDGYDVDKLVRGALKPFAPKLVIDVTEDKNYKNKNLATEITQAENE